MMIQILLSNMTNQLIKHPKQKIELEYSGLVGPEHAVFFRGHAKNKNTIRLPEHWKGLIDESTITVHLTPFGASQNVLCKGYSGQCDITQIKWSYSNQLLLHGDGSQKGCATS